ncbi:hypothetical protein PF003_g26297 [Phytophthora fragariae]|nr:hypothetical protein PF003_g26297 [Phytophthora fragariae]
MLACQWFSARSAFAALSPWPVARSTRNFDSLDSWPTGSLTEPCAGTLRSYPWLPPASDSAVTLPRRHAPLPRAPPPRVTSCWQPLARAGTRRPPSSPCCYTAHRASHARRRGGAD